MWTVTEGKGQDRTWDNHRTAHLGFGCKPAVVKCVFLPSWRFSNRFEHLKPCHLARPSTVLNCSGMLVEAPWCGVNVVATCQTYDAAFAVRLRTEAVVTWGQSLHGGESTGVATLLGERWPSVCITCCDKIWEMKLVCGLRCFFFLNLLSDRFNLIKNSHRCLVWCFGICLLSSSE